MYFTKPKQSSLFNSQLAKKSYLQISVFLDLVVVEKERVFYALQKKTIKKVTSEVVKSWLARHNQA